MRFSTVTTPAAVLAFSIAAASAHSGASTSSDLDGSVWEKLKTSSKARGPLLARTRSRPVKRQSGWSPPDDLVTPLSEVWAHYEDTYSDLFGFKNYGMDQIMATEGKINYCVRWDSTATITETMRATIAEQVNTQYQKWFEWLYGFDSFPYASVSVNVVGYAVKDASLLEGDASGYEVYTDTDADGVPQCAESCGRYFHLDGDYSSCAAGADRHYDQSLWLTDGLDGGFGGDWGQQVGQEYFFDAAATTSDIHILLHEMGHTFGLDDFYDWTPTGITNFIMLAGSSMTITDFDGWMLRNWWYELSRNRDWQSSSSNTGTSATATAEAPVATSTQEPAGASTPALSTIVIAPTSSGPATVPQVTPTTPAESDPTMTILPIEDDEGCSATPEESNAAPGNSDPVRTRTRTFGAAPTSTGAVRPTQFPGGGRGGGRGFGRWPHRA